MTKINEKISTLKAKLQALEAEQKAQERATRQAERQRARKADNQRKFELGGLTKLAGLFDCDKGALLGGFLALQRLMADADQFSEFKRAGDALLAEKEQQRKSNKQDDNYLQ